MTRQPDQHPNAPARGLTSEEVADRVARGLVNRKLESSWTEYRDLALRNTATAFNFMVLPAAAALFLLADYRAAWAVSALAVINSTLGLVQEFRAKRRLEKLALLAESKVRVRRDGVDRRIAASEVVRDDVLLLSPGEVVAADGTLIESIYLEMDEALLTGESDPVPRAIGDRVLSSSYCVAGEGAYRVDQVGADSFANRTSAEARLYQFNPSPLQRTLDRLIRLLTAAAVALCVGYVGLYFARRFPVADFWQMVAATVTAMVPQGLVLMTTLAFTLAALRMSARGASVQRLNAVESMASVTVLCLDKTGTLTTGRLSLDRILPLEAEENDVRADLRRFAWLSLDDANKSIEALRAALGPLNEADLVAVDQLPFKSRNRYSAVRFVQSGEQRAFALGGFEALEPLLEAEAARRARSQWLELIPSGLRLLLFCRIEADAAPPRFDGSLADRRLDPLALVALADELRHDAPDVLKALADQGIELKIISGDHPDTVRATVRNLNLPYADRPAATGDQLAAGPELARLLDSTAIFGRVSPAQKLELVAELQRRGHHVAMIGDGINDVLSIKRADLGIAMGAGSSVAKTVAGLVLENDSFHLLPQTLEQGRILLSNLRRAAKLFLLKNVYSLLLIVIATGALALDFPYLPQQVTLLNALTIGAPAFLIMFSTAFDRRVRVVEFLSEVGAFVLSAGAFSAAAALTVWLVSIHRFGDPVQTQRTMLLATLIVNGLGILPIIVHRDWRLRAWPAAALAIYLAILLFEPTAYFFALDPLDGTRWTWACAAAAAAVAATAFVDRAIRSRHPRLRPAGPASGREQSD